MNVKKNMDRENKDKGDENYHTKESSHHQKAAYSNKNGSASHMNRMIQPPANHNLNLNQTGRSNIDLDDLGASPDEISLQDKNVVLDFGTTDNAEENNTPSELHS
jgi:hypothetical protein